MGKIVPQICTLEVECTEASDPFEKRVLSFTANTTHVVGRAGKQPPSLLEGTLVFDSRILSRKHAKLFVKGKNLYLLDLNSNHGTYVNGKKIPVEGSDPNSQVWNAHEVKTGDIVRFGTLRKKYASAEVLLPIEGRLTVTFAPLEKQKVAEARTKEVEVKIVPPLEVPSDGPQMVQKERQLSRRRTSPRSPPAKCDVRKWSMLQPTETGQRGTLTDAVETATNSSQTSPSEEPVDAGAQPQNSYYERWKETKRQFSAYRRQSLKMIVIGLLAALFYHLVANSLEATVHSMNSLRRFLVRL